MIEFLPPRDGAFGESGAADFVGLDGDDAAWGDEPPRSRWLTALAVLGVTGLLAGGVVAASPWSDDAAVPAPTTTTAPGADSTTSVPATTDDDRDAPDQTLPSWLDDSIPGLVLQDAGRFELAGASSYPNQGFGNGDPYDVWATDGATRTSGTWLVVSSLRSQGEYLSLRRDAAQIDLDGAAALVSTDPDGVVHLVVDRPAENRFELVAFGIELGRLLDIARQVRMELNGAGYGDLLDGDLRLDGLTRRITQEAALGYGPLGLAPMAMTYYVDPGTGEYVELAVASRDETAMYAAGLLRSTTLDETTLAPDDLAHLTQLRRLGLEAEARSYVRTDGWQGSAVVWPSVDGTIVTVTGNTDVSTLLGLAVQAVQAAPRQWSRAVRQTANGPGVELTRPPQRVVLAEEAAGQWQAVVEDGEFAIYGPSFSTFEPFEPPSGPTVTTYRSLDAAFVLVTNTWPNPGLSVRVTQPGVAPNDPVESVQLQQIDDRPVYAAVVRLPYPAAAFTVEWFDVEGTPVEGPAS